MSTPRPDACEIILWALLQHETTCLAEDVCWWDSTRAEACLLAAGMMRFPDGRWRITGRTAVWFEDLWMRIRLDRQLPRHQLRLLPPRPTLTA